MIGPAAIDDSTIRVWDLPTRIFHWLVVVLVIAAIVSARLGGASMAWQLRCGYADFTLLAFWRVWGCVGGRWPRFASFAYAPATSLRHLRGGSLSHEWHHVGHNPLGAWSVFALLGVLVAQVSTGLVADDEISTNGPLLRFVSSATSHMASRWHKGWGQWTIISLAVLHVVAIAFYATARGQTLVASMLHGDKRLSAGIRASTDNAASPLIALAIVAAPAHSASHRSPRSATDDAFSQSFTSSLKATPT